MLHGEAKKKKKSEEFGDEEEQKREVKGKPSNLIRD